MSDSNGSLPNSLTPEDKKITKKQIDKHWKDVIVPALEHLKPLGVKIAPLKKKKDKSYHKMPLVLVFLSMHIGEPIHVAVSFDDNYGDTETLESDATSNITSSNSKFVIMFSTVQRAYGSLTKTFGKMVSLLALHIMASPSLADDHHDY